MPQLEVHEPWRGAPPARLRSGWLHAALESDQTVMPPLSGDVQCDVCIVGGGFTGLWTAIELRKRDPAIDVRLIEADICGGGASGVNAGQLASLALKFPTLKMIMPSDEAVWITQKSIDALDELLHFIDDEGIDAEVQPGPVVWAATSRAQRGAWTETLEALHAAGLGSFREVSAAEVRAMVGSKVHYGAAVDPGSATLQPAKLALGLRRVAAAAGVAIHERTPLTALASGPRTVATTPNGRVFADKVVLAINAWAARIEDIGSRLVMVASDNLLTAPIPAELDELPWTGAESVADSRRRLNYYRTTPDRRLLFGKGGVAVGFGARSADRMWHATPRRKMLRRQLIRTFPSLIDAAVDSWWTAPVEYSVTSLPFVGRLKAVPTVSYATGFSGEGIVPSRLVARILASDALSARDEWTESSLARPPAARLPVEPLRYVGARVVLSALTKLEDLEDRDEHVPALMRRVAEIDPTSSVG